MLIAAHATAPNNANSTEYNRSPWQPPDNSEKIAAFCGNYCPSLSSLWIYLMENSQIEALLNQGISHHENGQFQEAEACYKKALAIDPENADAIHLLGLLADAIGDKPLAIDLINAAISLDPSSAVFRNNLANIHKYLGESERAEARYLEALAILPTYFEAALNLANLYRDIGRPKDAVPLYQQVTATNPDSALAWLHLGESLHALEQYEEAVSCYRKYLDLRPEDPYGKNQLAEAYFALGRTCEDKGLVDDALDCFKEALAVLPIHVPSRKKIEFLNSQKLQRASAPPEIQHLIRQDEKNMISDKLSNLIDFIELIPKIAESLARVENRLAAAEQRLRVLESNVSFAVASLSSSMSVCNEFATDDYARKFYMLVAPMDVVGFEKIRLGRIADGGYVMLDDINREHAAYSFGICDDVSWDMDMARRGCEVYQYDHTINDLPEKNEHFHFFKKGIYARRPGDVKQDNMLEVDELIELNQHAHHDKIILKMDIEGYEWQVLESLSDETMSKFSQITLEIHGVASTNPNARNMILGVMEKMNRTHQSIHVHANNHGYWAIFGGIFLPDTFELSYVRRSDYQFSICTQSFPGPLDNACHIHRQDFYFGPIGLLARKTDGTQQNES